MGRARPFREWKGRLSERGFRPSTSRGQNFLVDTNLLDAIARDAAIEPDEDVLEIGPGPGNLTSRIAGQTRSLLALEVDPRLAEEARAAIAGIPHATIEVGDALGGKKRGLHPRIESFLAGGRGVVVANLPYSIAAPLLVNLFSHTPPPSRALVMIQREVADRLLAREGTRTYGPLTVALGARAEVERVREVPPDVFRPRPRVESCVVRIRPRADRPVGEEARRLDDVVSLAFGERRKRFAPRLARLLGGLAEAEAALAELGHPPDARGESLPLSHFVALARRAASRL